MIWKIPKFSYPSFWCISCKCTVVKVLRYKSEGRWSGSRWCHWNFSLT